MGTPLLVLGPILAGTWLNTILLTFEWTQAFDYFSLFKNDHKPFRIIVSLCLLFDFVGSICVYYMVYYICVMHWGEPESLAIQNWAYPLHHILVGLVQVIVQNFLIWRFYSLSKNVPITIILVAGALSCLAGALMTSILIILNPTFEGRNKLLVACDVWFISAGIVDVAIAGAMIWKLSSYNAIGNTRTLIHRIIRSAISTGSLTAAWALLVLVSFRVWTATNIPAFFSLTIARVYTVSMLYSLNMRKRDSLKWGSSAGGDMSGRDARPGDVNLQTLSLGGGVHMHRVVHVDTEVDTAHNLQLGKDQHSDDNFQPTNGKLEIL
ncbi:hypothetical protein DL96DRAFT_1712134 [Flagelloscypha sp. PMI_526]|nr:hypothetical protein DL96DRAFT_1712134 [Flagelloscypha sp. PMI_526]